MTTPYLAALTFAALSSGLVAAAPAAAQDFAYKPGTQRYRLDQTLSQSQEMQGQAMDLTITSAQFVSLVAAAQGGGLGLTYTIDSVRFDAPTGSAAAAAEASGAVAQGEAQAKALAGKQIVAAISPLGAVSSIAPADTADVAARAMAPGFRSFLVAFPTATVRPGMTWTDTVKTTTTNMGIDVTATSITTHTVAGDTTVYGRRAWKVDQTGTIALSGRGSAQGNDIAMSGDGSSTGTTLVAVDGVFLGGVIDQVQKMVLEVPAAGMNVPITNTVRTRIVPVE